nr:helix-turn-helix transcriptional regulator [Spelaeicoccus albus]
MAENLRAARKARFWSQEELGERVGVDRKTVNRIENGSSSPSFDLVVDLATTLEVPVEYLVRDPHQFDGDE